MDYRRSIVFSKPGLGRCVRILGRPCNPATFAHPVKYASLTDLKLWLRA
jgi:hypothetical protein